MSLALLNARVLSGDDFETGATVVLRDDSISHVAAAHEELPPGTDTVDLEGLYLAPGFIDLQVNGGGNALFNDDPSVETLRRIAGAHRRFGTTGLLPTLISTDFETMLAAVRAVADAIEQNVHGILGIHLEGPMLSAKRKGVHDAANFRVLATEQIDELYSLARGVLKMTVAPDAVPAEIIRYLVSKGFVVFAGHSNADFDTARAALSAGVSGFTHLYNAMSPLRSRAPGMVGCALTDPESAVGIVADGQHVSWASLHIALLSKPVGRCVLVSDAMPPVGGTESSFALGDTLVTCRNGICATIDGTLGGSCLDMATAVKNATERLGVSLAEACRMASAYPAAAIGRQDAMGEIAAGYEASLIAFDDDLVIRRVWIKGEEYAL